MRTLLAVVFSLILPTFAFSASESAEMANNRYCTVEIGSKGVASFVFSFPSKIDLTVVQTVFDKKINTGIVGTMRDGKFSEQGIHETAEAVVRLIGEARAVSGHGNLACWIVGSSGVGKGTNKVDLFNAIKRATGESMEFIDSDRETYFSLISTIKPERRDSSILMDIGSGNTKIGYLASNNNFFTVEVPYGAVSLKNAVLAKTPTNYIDSLSNFTRDNVLPAFRDQVQNRPGLANRVNIYWVGGAAWVAATFAHPEQVFFENVEMSRDELDILFSKLKNDNWNEFYYIKQDIKTGDAARKEVKRVLDTFTREDIIAGIGLMRTLMSAFNSKAWVVFKRYGQWLPAYSIERYKEEQARSKLLPSPDFHVQIQKNERSGLCPIADHECNERCPGGMESCIRKKFPELSLN